jgi:hypothetical protein
LPRDSALARVNPSDFVPISSPSHAYKDPLPLAHLSLPKP